LVVVPSFFLIMDDLSRLLAWIFGRLIGKKDEEQEVMENAELTRILNDNSRTISSLEERLQSLEADRPVAEGKPSSSKSRHPAANDIQDKPLAAE
jgi:hypothetical protein